MRLIFLIKSASPMQSADQALIAETTAKMLLEVKAVLLFEEKPFIFTSGWASPVYIDCRKLIFYPRIRRQLVDFAEATLARDAGFEQFDVVAGGETAGIPYAAWIADRLGLPMQYIRKKPKGFGRNAQIEGDVREGARTLLVEDLTTDGRSKVNFCQAVRKAGAQVEHVFVNFYYDIFPESKKVMSELGVKLHYLATWWDVLAVVKKGGYFAPKVVSEVERFMKSPAKWSAEHGGVAAFPKS
jgi:orotate phosphoribosyltransferase